MVNVYRHTNLVEMASPVEHKTYPTFYRLASVFRRLILRWLRSLGR